MSRCCSTSWKTRLHWRPCSTSHCWRHKGRIVTRSRSLQGRNATLQSHFIASCSHWPLEVAVIVVNVSTNTQIHTDLNLARSGYTRMHTYTWQIFVINTENLENVVSKQTECDAQTTERPYTAISTKLEIAVDGRLLLIDFAIGKTLQQLEFLGDRTILAAKLFLLGWFKLK